MNKKRNSVNDKPIRQVNAFTVRFVFPPSRTKKKRLDPKENKIINITTRMITLVNIWYTPTIA